MIYVGHTTSGLTIDAYFFDRLDRVWNAVDEAWQTWSDASFADYRVVATEIGTTGDYAVDEIPSGSVRVVLRVHGTTLANSYAKWADSVAPAEPEGDASAYLTLAGASALLATMPSTVLAGYRAASDADKVLLLAQATYEIDQVNFQGRKYDSTQARQFPRVPYETNEQVSNWPIGARTGVAFLARGSPAEIWDWDETTQTAVVPRNVKLAVLWQADADLDAARAERLNARHDGLASQSAAGLSESYRADAGAGDAASALCRQAARLLQPYLIRVGRIL